MGPTEGRRAEDFFALKNPTALAGFEPANLGTKGQYVTSRSPKPTNILVSHRKDSHPWNMNVSVSIPQPVISETFLSLSSYLYHNLCEILGFRYGTVEVPTLLGCCRGKYIGFISSVNQ
jgi:hypothetical protein